MGLQRHRSQVTAVISAIELLAYGLVGITLIPIALLVLALARYMKLWANIKHAGRETGVRWWDAAGPLSAVAVLYTFVWRIGSIPAEGDPGRTVFIFAAAITLVGGIGATIAIGNLDEYRQVASGVEQAGGVGDGPTVLSGNAEAYDEPLSGPVSGESALYYTLRITERRGIGFRTVPAEIHYEQSSDWFVLDDDTGTVIIDPTDGAVRFGNDPGISDARRSDPDDSAVTSIRDRLGLDPDDRTYKERRLEPESAVTVLGTVSRDPESRYPVVGDGSRRLVVFEGDIDTVRDSLRSRLRAGTALSVIGFGIGTIGMLFIGGVL